MANKINPFYLRWKTYNHLDHPFGDLIWHLTWGIIVGISLVYAIKTHDFWFLIITFISLIFFFHPKFYEPKLMDVLINHEGIYIDEKFYPWDDFYAFEIFENNFRKFIFFFPNKISLGLNVPLEEFFVDEETIKKTLTPFLKELKNSVPFMDRLYRAFFI